MVSIETFRQFALSFPNTNEEPHFEKTSFRANNKIFATLDAKKNLACLLFDPIQQSVFSAYDNTIIYPVPNKWGQKGATYVELKKVRKDVLKDALEQAYNKVVVKSVKKK